ncbi:MAG: hypothetical protein II971_03585, partial [Firmicutes bacterium]|nr:hypothetical protein [Bacillota bacterium]
MPTKEELLNELFSPRMPSDFTLRKLDSLMSKCGYVKGTGGRGSAVEYSRPGNSAKLIFDAYGIIGLNSKGSANKGFLKPSPILFSPQMRLMIDLRRKHAQNEDLSAKRSAACNSGSTVSDVVPSRL